MENCTFSCSIAEFYAEERFDMDVVPKKRILLEKFHHFIEGDIGPIHLFQYFD